MRYPRNAIASTLIIAALCFTHIANAEEVTSTLEGEWKVSEMVFHGQSITKRVTGTKFVFSDDRMTIDSAGVDHSLYNRQAVSISVSSDGATNSIDTINLDGKSKGTTRSGIFKVEGDTLTLCLPTESNAGRPNDFLSTQESKLALYIMHRVTSK